MIGSQGKYFFFELLIFNVNRKARCRPYARVVYNITYYGSIIHIRVLLLLCV